MSQKPDIDQSPEQAPEQAAEVTSTGESLDTVLSSIREAVTSHAEGDAPGTGTGARAPGRITPLAAAFDDLRREIAQLRENLNQQQSMPDKATPDEATSDEAAPVQASALGQKELEALIAKIVQPMLRAWLDAHLPPLAERLIREEIEKLSRER